MRHPEPATPHPQLALPLLADSQHLVGRQIGHVFQALEARIDQHLRRDDPADRQVPRRVLHDAVAPGVDAEEPPETVEDADVGDEGGEGGDGLEQRGAAREVRRYHLQRVGDCHEDFVDAAGGGHHPGERRARARARSMLSVRFGSDLLL